MGYEGEAKAPYIQTATSRINALREDAEKLEEFVRMTTNRLFGPLPESPAQDKPPAADGDIGMLFWVIDDLREALNRVAVRAERLGGL